MPPAGPHEKPDRARYWVGFIFSFICFLALSLITSAWLAGYPPLTRLHARFPDEFFPSLLAFLLLFLFGALVSLSFLAFTRLHPFFQQHHSETPFQGITLKEAGWRVIFPSTAHRLSSSAIRSAKHKLLLLALISGFLTYLALIALFPRAREYAFLIALIPSALSTAADIFLTCVALRRREQLAPHD